jgi:hypothetical protein
MRRRVRAPESQARTQNRHIADLARNAAWRELARRHHEEFSELYLAERKRRGWKPLPIGRPVGS